MSAARKTADNLVELMVQHKMKIEGEYGMKLIGWVSDAGGDSRGARKRLAQRFPRLLVPDCYAHQVSYQSLPYKLATYIDVQLTFIAPDAINSFRLY